MANTQRRLIRRPAVTDRTGLSRTTIWRAVRAGTFPVPVPIGQRAMAWVEAEVDAWIEARLAERSPVQQAA